MLSRPFHLFFRVPDLFGKLGVRPGTFYLAMDRNGLWANIRVIDPVGGLWRLMVLDSPADQIRAGSIATRICAARWAGTSTWNGSVLAYGRGAVWWRSAIRTARFISSATRSTNCPRPARSV